MQPAMEKVLTKIQEDATNTKEELAPKLVRVTPKLAQDILALQDPAQNRKLDTARVHVIANLIHDGKWNSDVGSVLITKNGRLIDGQHRLRAIIEANKAVTVLVLFGVGDDAIKYVDTGKRRTTGQTLSIMGKKTAPIRLATANMLAHFEKMTAAGAEPQSIAPRNLVLDPDSVIEHLEKYAKEMEDMSSVLVEHGAACVYAPLVYAARKFPKAATEALQFIKDGQVTNQVLKKFHVGQKRLLKQSLGSGVDRSETALFVFELIRALQKRKAPKSITRLKDGPAAHQLLVSFFSPDSKETATDLN